VLINQRIRDALNSFTLADLAENRVEQLVKDGRLKGSDGLVRPA
jgi:hypothetical protein